MAGPDDTQAENESKRRASLAARVAGVKRDEPERAAESPLPASGSAQQTSSATPGMDRMVKRNKWPPRRIGAFGVGGLFAISVIYQLLFGDHSTRLNVQRERITVSTVERGPFQEFIPVRGEVLPIQRSSWTHRRTDASRPSTLKRARWFRRVTPSSNWRTPTSSCG